MWLVTGLVSGFLVLLAAVFVVVFVIRRRKSQKAEQVPEYDPNTVIDLPPLPFTAQQSRKVRLARPHPLPPPPPVASADTYSLDEGYLHMPDYKPTDPWFPGEDYLTTEGYGPPPRGDVRNDGYFRTVTTGHGKGVTTNNNIEGDSSRFPSAIPLRSGIKKYSEHRISYTRPIPELDGLPADDNWMSKKVASPATKAPIKYRPGSIIADYDQRRLLPRLSLDKQETQ